MWVCGCRGMKISDTPLCYRIVIIHCLVSMSMDWWVDNETVWWYLTVIDMITGKRVGKTEIRMDWNEQQPVLHNKREYGMDEWDKWNSERWSIQIISLCWEYWLRELICRIRRVFYHESFSFESIVFIVMTVYELCSDHSDNEWEWRWIRCSSSTTGSICK